MRRLVAAALGLAGCYDPALAPWDGGGGTGDATAPAGDGAEADGAPDGGLLEIDARVVLGCPGTSPGCTVTASSSST